MLACSSLERNWRQRGTSPVSFSSVISYTSDLVSNPISEATIEAVSKSIIWLMFAMTPLDIKILITWMGLADIFSARSRTVMLPGNSIVFNPLSLISTSFLVYRSRYP